MSFQSTPPSSAAGANAALVLEFWSLWLRGATTTLHSGAGISPLPAWKRAVGWDAKLSGAPGALVLADSTFACCGNKILFAKLDVSDSATGNLMACFLFGTSLFSRG